MSRLKEIEKIYKSKNSNITRFDNINIFGGSDSNKLALIGHHSKIENARVENEPMSKIMDKFSTYENEKLKPGVMQVFVSSINRQTKKTESNITCDEDAETIKSYCAKNDIRLIVHSSYKVAMCGKNPHYTYHLAINELELANKMGAQGYVIHLSRNNIKEINDFIYGLCKKIKGKMNGSPPIMYLEPIPYPITRQGEINHKMVELNKFYLDPFNLAKLVNRANLTAKKVDPNIKFGVCLDTAHVWAMGGDISSTEATTKYLDDFTDAFTDELNNNKSEYQVLFHLNDQVYEFSDGKDAHSPLGYGTIWSPYRSKLADSGLKVIVDYIQKYEIPTVLERSAYQKVNGFNEESEDTDCISIDYMNLQDLV